MFFLSKNSQRNFERARCCGLAPQLGQAHQRYS
jgi:hypothetical protein